MVPSAWVWKGITPDRPLIASGCKAGAIGDGSEMNNNNQGAQTTGQTTMQPAQQQFRVDQRTLGRVMDLGGKFGELVAVTSDQDSDGRVNVKQLTGNNAGEVFEGVDAGKIDRISNKPGTASAEHPSHAKDNKESTLEMARRLSGRERAPRQEGNGNQSRPTNEERMYLADKPYGATVFSTYNHRKDQLGLRVCRVDDKKGLDGLKVSLRFVEEKSRPAVDRETGKEIPGKWYTEANYVIVVE